MARTRFRGKQTRNVTIDDNLSLASAAASDNLSDDLNYIRTSLNDLKGGSGFAEVHSNIPIASSGFANATGLPIISSTQSDSIVHALHLLKDNISGGGSVGIGDAEDGSYLDGLFTDFVPTTPVGTAIDRFNEVLKALSPPPSPNFSSVSSSDSGVSGKLSFGTSNVVATYTNHASLDINATVSVSGTSRGIFNASTVINGVLANNISAHAFAYPANSFGDGDQGDLLLVVNGVTVHTTDLTSFASGNSLNGNSSGFNLSASTPVEFEDTTPLDLFKYRTGTWTVSAADQQNGYNTVKIRHEYSAGLFRDSQEYNWIVDANVTATAYSGEVLDSLSMLGAELLSGVTYNTSGTAQYDLTIDNGYRNTYSSSGSAISHPTTTNCSVSSQSISNMTLESDSITLLNKSVTVDTGARLLDGALTVNGRTDRTVQTDANSSGVTSFGILLDPFIDDNGSSNTSEPLNDERYRMHNGIVLTNTNYGSGAQSSDFDWDKTQSLVGGSGTHNDGLLQYNGKLMYPTQGFDAGDFRNTTDGNVNGPANGPTSNPNYNAASGNRVYYRYFYDSSARQNFRISASVTGTSFVSVATGPSGNNLTMEVLAPNTTQNGSAVIEFKDMVVAFTNDNAIGAFAATFGASIPGTWGGTIGSRNTSTSGNVLVFKIVASSGWTGSIESFNMTWL